ncbi:MAG TPA: asparaginase [Acidimicrobiia bacterium]|nr:asparaginase [Acidimicrobiia bacterium]
MIVRVVRSGLVEAEHPVSAAAVDGTGNVLATFGADLDRDFFGRSVVKPFQTFVSQRAGAELGIEQTAIATASHGGQPLHVAFVRQMLAEADLSEVDLRCPPARPSTAGADRRWYGSGSLEPLRVFHGCSGKHAAMLRACRVSDWSLDYIDDDHPLHAEVMDIVSTATGRSVGPVGVDGCGVPTLRTDTVALARGYASLSGDTDFAPILEAIGRYTSLTSDGDRREAVIARWVPGFVKAGAAGCIAAAWSEGGVGFAAKAWTGDDTAATVALVGLMDRVGIVSDHQRDRLADVFSAPVLGGGVPVGRYELVAA